MIDNPVLIQKVHELVFNLLEIAVIGLTSLTAWGVKLWINSMHSAWKKTIAERFVKFAEQRIINNDEKLKYVSAELSNHFPSLKGAEIQSLVEEAVNNLRETNPPVPIVLEKS